MSNALLGIITALMVIGAGVLLLGRNGIGITGDELPAAVVSTAVFVSTSSPADLTSSVVSTSTATSSEGANAPKNVVTYTDAGFDPKVITIVQGETVTFEDKSAHGMQIFSDDITHGATTTIPENCDGSVFAECELAAYGASWSYTFSEPGSYNYHNNADPTRTGTVVVK